MLIAARVVFLTCVAVLGTGCSTKYGICPAPQPGHYYVTEMQGYFPRIAEYKVNKDGEFEFVRYVR
jgi:hypothetical protein